MFPSAQQLPSPDTRWEHQEDFQDSLTHSLTPRGSSHNWPDRKIKTQFWINSLGFTALVKDASSHEDNQNSDP